VSQASKKRSGTDKRQRSYSNDHACSLAGVSRVVMSVSQHPNCGVASKLDRSFLWFVAWDSNSLPLDSTLNRF
jgi:hypothetical protein